MNRVLIALGVLAVVCAVSTPSAENVKRPPDVQKLDMFVGDWTYEERGNTHDTGEEWVLKGTG